MSEASRLIPLLLAPLSGEAAAAVPRTTARSADGDRGVRYELRRLREQVARGSRQVSAAGARTEALARQTKALVANSAALTRQSAGVARRMDRQIRETGLLRLELGRVRGQLNLARNELAATRRQTTTLSSRVEVQTGEAGRLRAELRAHDQLLFGALLLSAVAVVVAIARGRTARSLISTRLVGEMRDRLREAESRLRSIEHGNVRT